MTTKVEINDAIQDQLDKDIKSGKFSDEVRFVIVTWKNEIQMHGHDEYITSHLAEALEDHPLSGKRQNERSIVLNETGGRLIYTYHKNKIVVKVIKITPDHDYN